MAVNSRTCDGESAKFHNSSRFSELFSVVYLMKNSTDEEEMKDSTPKISQIRVLRGRLNREISKFAFSDYRNDLYNSP